MAFGLDVTGSAADGYGGRLRQARERAGLTMERLAQLLGYASNSAVADLESEQRGLDLALAETAARAMGVTAVWLAFGVAAAGD